MRMRTGEGDVSTCLESKFRVVKGFRYIGKIAQIIESPKREAGLSKIATDRNILLTRRSTPSLSPRI